VPPYLTSLYHRLDLLNRAFNRELAEKQVGESTTHGMYMGIDNARHHHLAVQVNHFRTLADHRLHVVVTADFDELAILDGDGLYTGTEGINGMNIAQLHQH
jgi:hypothetical protein